MGLHDELHGHFQASIDACTAELGHVEELKEKLAEAIRETEAPSAMLREAELLVDSSDEDTMDAMGSIADALVGLSSSRDDIAAADRFLTERIHKIVARQDEIQKQLDSLEG